MNVSLVFLAAILLAACGPGANLPASPPPSTPPSPSGAAVTTPDAAAALVLAADPRFAGLKAQDPNLIGQCCFYEVTPSGEGYAVKVEIGWGDCPAGCINRHHWFYTVNKAGTVTLDREDGPEVPTGVPGTGAGTTDYATGIR